VLSYFSAEGVTYLELRTTPRHDPVSGMTRRECVEAVLDAFDEFASNNYEEEVDEDPSTGVFGGQESGTRMQARLILSVDRRFSAQAAKEIIDLARKFEDPELLLPIGSSSGTSNHRDHNNTVRSSQRRRRRRGWVVGVDLCGPPDAGDPSTFKEAFQEAKQAGLGLTIHFGEVCNITPPPLIITAARADSNT
jgi:adenosine deaminase